MAGRGAGRGEVADPVDDSGPIIVGALTTLLRSALAKLGISVQRYWNATMVGPDVRKFLKHFK